MSPEQVLDLVEAANLNGCGGAGFPAVKKRRFMPRLGRSPGGGPSHYIVKGNERLLRLRRHWLGLRRENVAPPAVRYIVGAETALIEALEGSIRIEVEGHLREVEDAKDLLSARTHQAVVILHFCWHDALGSVGSCRLCAVQAHDGPEYAESRTEMAGMTPVIEGKRISVVDAEAAEMRAHVIEWLMPATPMTAPSAKRVARVICRTWPSPPATMPAAMTGPNGRTATRISARSRPMR